MLEMIMKLNIPLYVMTSMGCIGGLGMLATNLTYRRMIRNTQRLQNLKEKWLNLWKSRDRLWHRMNRFVWYPSLFCTFLLGLSVFLNSRLGYREGLPMLYLYIGAAVPVVLLLLRQALDFSYKEELVMASLADYVEQVRTWVEEVPVAEKPDPVLQEEIVDKILKEFGLPVQGAHIINGHIPVIVKKGESPVKCGGKLLVIDGGFSKAYQPKTGIAGYTLIYNSYGLVLAAHEPFTSMEDTVLNETCIHSHIVMEQNVVKRKTVNDTDIGKVLRENIAELEELLQAYRSGMLVEKF